MTRNLISRNFSPLYHNAGNSPYMKFCTICAHPLRKKYIHEERHWRLVCRGCGNVHYINPRLVAGVVPLLNGKVIMGQRATEPRKGCWSFPAGFVEWEETPEKAAQREAWEEARVRVLIKSLLGVFSYEDGVVNLIYLAEVKPFQKPRSTREMFNVSLFTRDDIPWKSLAFRDTRDALKTCFKQHKG